MFKVGSARRDWTMMQTGQGSHLIEVLCKVLINQPPFS